MSSARPNATGSGQDKKTDEFQKAGVGIRSVAGDRRRTQCSSGNHSCSGSRFAICYAGRECPIPKRDGENCKADLWVVGKLFSQQLQNGAPFDMYFSRQYDCSRRNLRRRLNRARYVLSLRHWKDRDLGAERIKLRYQLRPSIADDVLDKIAIANPGHAPYGQAAVAAA